MLDHLLPGFLLLADPWLLLMLLVGVCIGLVFGLVPGLSGLSALAILLPLVYTFDDAFAAIGFLLGAHASVYAGGSVTAILLGIPGSPANSATVEDGHGMYLAGRGGEAIGAALAGSALGGITGAAVLIMLLPFLQPLILLFGAPEIFLICLLGIVWAAAFNPGFLAGALIAAGLGFFLATFGYQRSTGVPRFWFDIDYLLDGVRLIPLVLGLFAIPEIVSLAISRADRSGVSRRLHLSGFWRGAVAVVLRPALFLRSTFIGVLVGIVPGVGGETAPFLAHSAARFGAVGRPRDAIEGVIAPESSNNAKEGGSLLPTLALGIPGSASMSMLLGAFLVFGIEPGPDFLISNMEVATGLGIVLALSNLLAMALMVPLVLVVSRMISIPGPSLAPWLTLMAVIGAWLSSGDWRDVVALAVFGVLGVAMVRFGLSRPLLVLGFVLGPLIETYLHIAIRAYGWEMLTRPLAAVLTVFIILGLVMRLRSRSLAPRSRW